MKEQIYTVKVSKFGTEIWYKDSKCQILHRENGPAIKRKNGENEYFINGVLHREDGPAIINSYGFSYFIDGKLHREDGPAIEFSNGMKHYYLNGKNYSEQKYWEEVNNKSCSNKIVEIDGKKYKLIEL